MADSKAVFQTERLRIEYIDKKYMQDIFDERKNSEVNQYLASKTADTLHDLETWIDGVMKENGEKEFAQFQVSAIDTQEFIGMCVVKKINTPHPEIGLRIKQAAR